MISPERQLWRCFGCGKGGSVFDFVMEIEGVEFGDALKVLAQRAGVELKKIDPKLITERTRLYEITNLANRFFVKQLQASQAGKRIQKYLNKRGLKSKEIKDWQIGYAPKQWQSLLDFLKSRGYPEEEILKAGLAIKSEKNTRNKYYDRFRDRIIFPINDINGVVVGFTGRENPAVLDSRMGKYINTPNTLIYDKSRILYGLDKAKLAMRKNNLCVLVEGQTDVIMSHQAGLKNAVASSGTALTDQQLRIIKRYTDNLAMAFDKDSAGELATQRGIDLALQFGFNTKVINLPDHIKDPAEVIQQDASLWTQAVNQAQDLMDFYLRSALTKHNTETAQGKKEISKILLSVIRKIPNKVVQAHWLQKTARKLKVQETILMEEMKKIKNPLIERKFEPIEPPVKQSSNQSSNLEEYTLGLVLVCLKDYKKFRDKQYYLFSEPELEQIFKTLQESKTKRFSLKNFKKKLPTQLASKVDELIFKAETKKNLIDEFSPDKEIGFCFSQLENRYLRQKLNQLNLAIQEAESNQDKSALKKLTREFNKLAKRI